MATCCSLGALAYERPRSVVNRQSNLFSLVGFRTMNFQTITTRTGEALTLYQARNGNWCCPVCGSPELERAPYSETGAASFDMCNCGFEFGFDDDPDASAAALPTVAANIERWRSTVIAQHRSSAEKLAELRDQLASIGVRLV
jgi:predicted RNA-binding Zn-ribbon protein involved in translation (DUF1610 family)